MSRNVWNALEIITDTHIVSQYKNIYFREFSTVTGKRKKRTFSGSLSHEGCLELIQLDSSDNYAVTVSGSGPTGRSLYVIDYKGKTIVDSMCGHSERISGVKFTNDCRHIISVSADGWEYLYLVWGYFLGH